MTDRSIIVTEGDMERIKRLVEALKYSLLRDQRQLDLLDRALENAEVRHPSQVPRDVVRMNSRVCALDFHTRRKELYTLVFPDEARVSRGFISVLAPLGLAMIGHRTGDIIEAKIPGGVRRLRIEHVTYGPRSTNKQVLDGSSRTEHPSGQSIPECTLAA
jgi:regulator of nucleoside diphosphate kinase